MHNFFIMYVQSFHSNALDIFKIFIFLAVPKYENILISLKVATVVHVHCLTFSVQHFEFHIRMTSDAQILRFVAMLNSFLVY